MPDDVQSEIASTASSLLAAHAPPEGFGASSSVRPVDADLWKRCCELGWIGLSVPEDAGGVGLSLAEEVFLFGELGRGLANAPFLPGVLAARVAHRAGDSAGCAGIVSGDARVALAVETWSGAAETYAVHTDGAQLLVSVTPNGATLAEFDERMLRPVDPVDLSIATGRLVAAPTVVHEIADGGRLLAEARVLVAAMASGVAAAAMHLAVGYSKVREQFGKPVGSFQALKHFAADMAVRCELAEAQVWYAALAVRDEGTGWRTEADVALHSATEAARSNGESCVQMHGGIGFTSEALPHRYVARANLLGRLLGSRPEILAGIARAAGGER